MITPEEAREEARKNFLDGYACAPAVAAVFAKELGYDRDTLLKIMQPFGAGMCRMREVCGTVSGMMAALGMAIGSADGTKESKDVVYNEGQKLAEKFRESNGSIICRELLGLVPMGQSEQALKAGKATAHTADSPVSEARTPEYYKKRPCPDLCGDAAAIFAQWLNERTR